MEKLVFGEWLKQERAKRGVPALTIAGRSGFSHTTLHNIETGKKWPRRKTVEAIAAALCETNQGEEFERVYAEALAAAGYSVPESSLHAPAVPIIVEDATGQRWRVQTRLGEDEFVMTPEMAKVLAALGVLGPVEE